MSLGTSQWAVAERYVAAVVDGTIPAGKYHRRACARHLRDLARQGTPDFPYRFDVAHAERFFRFAARLKHYKGEWAGQFIRLQPYQLFRLGSIFGWIHGGTGLRRFRTAYNELPRKNGKSLEAAIVALYVTFFDNEPGAEGYCVATKREQARIVFRDCKELVRRSDLRSRISGAGEKHGTLHRASTASKLEALGADSEGTDGLNPNLIINDEFHRQKDRDLLDVLETATGARRQPLNFQITTAGDDPQSPCGDQHDYACKVLDQVLDDETFFAFIAHADVEDKDAGTPADDWTLETTWRKANPNYGISVRPDDLRALATKAIHMQAAAAAFQQKRLNLWVSASLPWLSIAGWQRGQRRDGEWSREDLRGLPCWVGVDMSSKIDLTAVAFVFRPPEGGGRWRVLLWCLTPEATLEDRARRDRAPYLRWVKDGVLTTNPGNRIDQDQVRAVIAAAADEFDIRQIGVDPWNAGNLVKHLQDDGRQVIEVPQTLQHMSGPSKDFEADVLDGDVDGNANPLLFWAVSNVVVQRDNKDNIYPVKKKSRGRIDPVIATLIGRKLAALEHGDEAVEDPILVTA